MERWKSLIIASFFVSNATALCRNSHARATQTADRAQRWYRRQLRSGSKQRAHSEFQAEPEEEVAVPGRHQPEPTDRVGEQLGKRGRPDAKRADNREERPAEVAGVVRAGVKKADPA